MLPPSTLPQENTSTSTPVFGLPTASTPTRCTRDPKTLGVLQRMLPKANILVTHGEAPCFSRFHTKLAVGPGKTS